MGSVLKLLTELIVKCSEEATVLGIEYLKTALQELLWLGGYAFWLFSYSCS